MARAGRPRKEFDKKAFADLVAMGCTQEEICWFFRDENGKVANVDTLSRWCQREFGVNFQEYSQQNKLMGLKIQLRKNQFELSKKNPSMAIWLGKQYLGQKDPDKQIAVLDGTDDESVQAMMAYFRKKKETGGNEE